VANANYWDKRRGPRVREVVFRNDLSPEEALELVCTTEGEVDIVTEVAPADAERVEASGHARLVSVDAIRVVAGAIDREAEGLPLGDRYARLALNLAVDRDRLVREALFGRSRPLAGLTPPSAVTFPHRRLRPYRHDPVLAAAYWQDACRLAGVDPGRVRPIRLGALGDATARVARWAARDLREALGVEVEVRVYRDEEEHTVRRRLAEKDRPLGWDVLVLGHGAQAADAPPLELHRAFVGRSGEFRAGPVVPEFEALYEELARRTSRARIARASYRIDRFVHGEAPGALPVRPANPLCGQQARRLHAVPHDVRASRVPGGRGALVAREEEEGVAGGRCARPAGTPDATELGHEVLADDRRPRPPPNANYGTVGRQSGRASGPGRPPKRRFGSMADAKGGRGILIGATPGPRLRQVPARGRRARIWRPTPSELLSGAEAPAASPRSRQEPGAISVLRKG
jgi:peptide/nickel transport system substrate-binding protein